MPSAPVFNHLTDAHFSVLAREAWETGSEQEPEDLLLDDRSLEQLTTRNAQLVDGMAAKFPENPLYPATLMVALVGAFIDFLFLIR